MDKWAALNQKERELMEKEEIVFNEKQQLQRVKEVYEEHFAEAYHFIDDLRYLFHGNDRHEVYETAMDTFSKKAQVIMENLEDRERELRNQKKQIEQDILDTVDAKRKVMFHEKEENNEY